MRTLKKFTINEADLSAQSLTRERMKALKGGGGNCYFYCYSGGSTSLTIVPDCSKGQCPNGKPSCSCY